MKTVKTNFKKLSNQDKVLYIIIGIMLISLPLCAISSVAVGAYILIAKLGVSVLVSMLLIAIISFISVKYAKS